MAGLETTELAVYGGTALTMNPAGDIVENAVIRISEGHIRSVTSEPDFDPAKLPPQVRALDASRCLVLPGLVNGHTHSGMSLLRGVADDMPLRRWLDEKIFPLERRYGSPEFVRLGTQLAAVEMIRSGTTTFNDMYYHEQEAAKVAHEAGLRTICGQTIVEISQVQGTGDDLFDKFDEFLAEVKDYPLAYPAITPHSIYGVSEATWRKIVAYAAHRDLILHFHLAETKEEEDECLRQFGKRPVHVLGSFGLWDLPRVIAAHGTCLAPDEIEVLGQHGVGVVHNPESNLKLRTQICPVVALRRAGVPVALGTDGPASNNNLDMLQEADTAAKLQIYQSGEGVFKAPEVVKCLTIEGARALGLDSLIGSLEVGKRADLIAVDIHRAHALPLYSPYSHLVYSASGADVRHTVVDGRVLMENWHLATLDEEAILAAAEAFGKRLQRESL